MKWQHTLVWSCQTPRHTDLSFGTSEECEMHMRQEHSEDISIDQLAVLVEKSAHPAADPLEVLVRYEKVGSEDRSVCPLCPFAIENTRIPEPRSLIPDASLTADDAKAMRDHVAEHLESIALLSLLEQEIDDAASDEVQSESARISSHGEGHDLDPLPHLTSEDWDGYNSMAVASGLDSRSIVQEARITQSCCRPGRTVIRKRSERRRLSRRSRANSERWLHLHCFQWGQNPSHFPRNIPAHGSVGIRGQTGIQEA